MARDMSDMETLVLGCIAREVLIDDLDELRDLFPVEATVPSILLGGDLQSLFDRHVSGMQIEAEVVGDVGGACHAARVIVPQLLLRLASNEFENDVTEIQACAVPL